MPQQTAHPSVHSLRLFGLGKLDESASTAVAEHLEGCDACREAVASAGGDSFMGRLRAADRATPGPSVRNGAATADLDRQPELSAKNSPASASLDLPPELVNHAEYEVVRELGRGGMGVVYLARHRITERVEVLKVVSRALVDNPDALARFQREIVTTAKLQHPNIVRVHTALRLGDLLAMVTEYVDGLDLAAVVAKKGPLPLAYACRYTQSAAAGLQYAFEQQTVHRDIKPGNLMLSRKGQVKILDFGLGKAASERKQGKALTGDKSMMGTPDFIAPEQAYDARTADHRADIYSLGCTLFTMLAGRPPFPGGTVMQVIFAHMENPPPRLDELRPDVPAGLADVVVKMMAKKPAERYQTPAEVAAALAPFAKVAQSDKFAPPSVKVVPPVQSPAAETYANADTSKMPVAGPPQPVEVALPQAVSVFTELAPAPNRVTSKKSPIWLPFAAVGLAAALVLAVIVTVITWKTPDGTVILEGVPADAVVTMDGKKLELAFAGDANPARVELAPGTHSLKVTKGGFEAYSKELTLVGGKSQQMRIALVPAKLSSAPAVKPQDQSKVVQLSIPEAAKSADGFVSLFNGKDLTGWQTFDGSQTCWRVENGSLIAERPNFGYLFYTARRFSDVHLRVEARINDGGDSGLNVLTQISPAKWLTGFEAQIDSRQTGSIYRGPTCVNRVLKSQAKPGVWFTLELVAQGDHFRTLLDGQPTAQHTSSGRRPADGHVALQAFEKITRVEFRKIEVKELTPETKTAANRSPVGPVYGKWRVDGTELVQEDEGKNPLLIFGDAGWKDYDFSCQIQRLTGQHGISALFRAQKPGDWYHFQLGPYGNKYIELGGEQGGRWYRDVPLISGSAPPGEWRDALIKVRGNRADCFLDGKLVLSHTNGRIDAGRVGFRTFGSTARFRAIKVTAPDGTILWEGLPDLNGVVATPSR